MAANAFQDLGNRLTKALISGDFVAYSDLVILPVRMTPRDGSPYVLESPAALQADFDLYHAVIRLHGVTDIFRDVQEVTPDGPGRAVVRVITHILQRANRVADPFVTRFFLRQVGDAWKITEIESSQEHMNWTRGHKAPGFGWV